MLPLETTDPWGRRVVLTLERWLHVITRHPQLVPMISDVVEVVSQPDVITPDPDFEGRWRYWGAEIGPTRWMLVVVAWSEGAPHIVTAFPSRRIKL